MALMSAADYRKLNLRELLWFYRQLRPGEITTLERTTPIVVRKSVDLNLSQAEFVAFWARDNIRNHPQNPWNIPNFKSSTGMSELYDDLSENEEEGDEGREDANDTESVQGEVEEDSSHEAEVDEDVHGESEKDPEDDSKGGLDGDLKEDEELSPEVEEDSSPEVEEELQETENTFDRVLKSVIVDAPYSSDSNDAFSSAHNSSDDSPVQISSDDTPAQTNRTPVGPPEMPKYTKLKQDLQDVIAQVEEKGPAKVLSDLQELNQG
jgi:hypothetical protein